jgi:hypothetical protein
LNSFFSNFIQIFSGELANFSNKQKESATSTGGDGKQKELEKDPSTVDDEKQKDPPAENGSKNEDEKLSEENVIDEKAETETKKVEPETEKSREQTELKKEKIVDEVNIE